jgi:hypothetical protein
MPVIDADVIADVADRLFGAIESSDIAMVQQLWNEDVVVWKVADRDRDRDRALRVINWFINTTTDRHYEILDRQFRRRFRATTHPARQGSQRRIDLDAGLHRDQVGLQRPDQSYR